ncbi:hypothetical protein SAMN04487880_3538 [Marinobacter sp. es.042]|uniref:hypothetical protein n=1 Tax=Marinobacter sp. es.042 TaxID=1761794 RepID=UPI000B60DEBE|nr:hypothetical protein [Marinobacter sp. es.042]SNB59292.1 hypothetical protein SAMN04487880_3538 [Marinobacter sp. es.042]
MNVTIFDKAHDSVIDSVVATGKITYQYAIDNLFPLIDRFSGQRKIQDKKFYARLERDILDHCLMPPITIAFVEPEFSEDSIKKISDYISDNIESGYILDGIQRLNTLKRASADERFDGNHPLYINVIIAPSEDRLLYRMITLNNGQRPMTPRHQIEILTQELFDFSDLSIKVQTEKERAKNVIKGSFDLGDLSKAYLAFLTGSVNNDNNKIIGEKMDQIIVGRIMDRQPKNEGIDFKNVIKEVDRFSSAPNAHKWFKVGNNLIGFSVGIKKSYPTIKEITEAEFSDSIDLFESAFKYINPSKVNLGKYRRELSQVFIEKYQKFSKLDEMELAEQFMEITS